MMLFDRNFREIFSTQTIALIAGLIGGTILAIYVDKILLIPGMLILLPGFLEMRGSISGSLASRLTSGLFLGKIKPGHTGKRVIRANILASFILAVSVSTMLGVLALVLTYFIFQQLVYKLVFIALFAGLITNVIQIPITIKTTLYLYKKGFDPNNIMGPFTTSTGDIISILSLLAVIILLV